jgi:hypothetical protein
MIFKKIGKTKNNLIYVEIILVLWYIKNFLLLFYELKKVYLLHGIITMGFFGLSIII